MDETAPTFGPRGTQFWNTVQRDYTLAVDETELLIESCALLDEIDLLRAAVADDGPVVKGYMGQPRPHPALASLRAAQLALSRFLAQLGLPDEHGKTLPTAGRLRAVQAASARWHGNGA